MKRHSTSFSSERPSKGAKLNECTVAPTQEVNYSSTVNQEVQQKIDKQNALLKFKTEQKTLKEVKCSSCGLTTHARSTNNFPDERVENFVSKTSLPNVCNNQQLVQHTKDLADYTTKVLFVRSLFANFIFIKLLDDGQAISIIEQSLFTNIFAAMTGNGKRAPNYLKEYFTLFCELTTVDRDSLKSINYSSILSIAGKQYEVLTHEQRSIANCSLVYFIYKQKQGSEPSWPSSVPCTSMWSKYQPDQCDSDTLYSKPHLFFKWFYFLSQEVQKKSLPKCMCIVNSESFHSLMF
ncbi:uncharacterized protein RHIMIDRAFT_274939 [Rhizopus microsporus ATCC 52813]|uniref:Uncharacterized protein n=1 Tax=Rhizopus microsporus ATCC 52813 TaxID=1340429 RepID=A0A2G4SG45_RHIZD|nr:uncharacterized protein RHIMIDRAFT_274939 [Rhizopus microsporus ATCC 52813]PHZ07366.1 hypothetical protein RHIMIDRAFT_274939 [Rhizopus microsporus ATCC 52813]